MEKEFIEKMKASLLAEKKQILESLASKSTEMKQIVEAMEAKDEVDIASDAIDGNMIEAIGTKDLNKIKLIDKALTKIEQGKYGICVKCGKKISPQRLEAIPYALMCIDCKSADERKNR